MSQNNLTRTEAEERARLVSGVSYEVELDLTGDADTFGSTTIVRFKSARAGASTFLDLVADGIDGRVAVENLKEDNEIRIEARCAYMRTGAGLHRFADPVDGRVYLHTQFEPFDAHRVFACFDQPDIKAPWTLTVKAPEDWVVVANTPPERDGGTWRFPETPRLSTYLYAVVAGPYHVHEDAHRDIPLGLYCRQSLARYLDVDELLEVTRQGLDFFEELYDARYPFGKYDQLFVPEFSAGAMENAGCVTFNESYLFRSKVTESQLEGRANTILHEMAHMWFGDLVTMRWWDDLWLNESFATYMATAAIVGATRFTGGWARFAAGTKTAAYAQDQLPSTHPISADIPDTEATRTHFDAITYQKGASVLRQLVAWVGEEAFRSGVRAYFRRHAWGNAELRDFLAALEETSGRDLAAWSREWLETAGVNTLRPRIDGEEGIYRSVEIVQDGDPARSHRVAVGSYALSNGALVRLRSDELDVTGDATPVASLIGQPVAGLLLLNDEDLAYAKIRLDAASLTALGEHLGAIEDELARSLCWSAVWDMVRDAELPTARYVDLIASHVHREQDVGTVARLVGQAAAAVDAYGEPARRGGYRTSLGARCRDAFEAAEPGGDAQLTWGRLWIGLDDSVDGVAAVRGLLDGAFSPHGLTVDTDLRWHVVASLAQRGLCDERLIDAELQRDSTDIGLRRSLAAKASMPAREAKDRAWTSLLEDVEQPLATIRAVGSAFHQPAQDEVLLAYVERYVDALPGIWSSRDRDVALSLTRALYPATIIDERVVEATDRALGAELPAAARRVLVEGKDRTARARRARAADR